MNKYTAQIFEAARDQLAHLDESAGQAQADGQLECAQSLRDDALKLSVALNECTGGDEQHWIVSVQDSINGYKEVATAYYDGNESDARDHFMKCKNVTRYFLPRSRYQISMTANPVMLQWPES